MTAREPTPGDVVYVGPGCGVPFTWAPILFRVISIERPHLSETAWLHGYQINEKGHAFQRRDLYVVFAGLRLVPMPGIWRTARRNGGPALPQQRTQPTTETRTGATR